MTKRVVALTFHDVGGGTPGLGEPFYRIDTADFERLLAQLRQLGYQTVSSRAFRAWQQNQAPLPERVVILTFDDGYASHLDVVASLLRRYRFTGTFFVTVDRIGQPGYLTWDQLRQLVFIGMEIGAHGMTHRNLTSLSRAEMDEELRASKRRLEEQLGVPIRALAAPGGAWNRQAAQAAQAAGYDAVWVSTIGTNGRETNAQALRRVVVRQPVSVGRLIALLEGWQLSFWMAARQQTLIRLLKRLLGAYWYEQLKRKLVPHA
jgi:peptidoglycan/xylan/chitin deacetylase (PgdA/CDA1 family)